MSFPVEVSNNPAPLVQPAAPAPPPWHQRLLHEPPYWGILVVAPILALLVWEGAVRGFGISSVLLPTPSSVLVALLKYAFAGTMAIDLAASLRRVVMGMAVGGSIGIAFGILMGWYPRVRAALHVLVASTFPIPKIALVPLMIIWFGMGDSFKVALVSVSVFFIMLTNTMAGVESISHTTIMAAQNLGAGDLQLLRKVVLPASLPMIWAGLRISFSVALIMVIAAEMILSRDGVGNFLVFAGQLLETEKIFAGLILTGLVGVVGYACMDVLEAWLVPHRKRRRGGRG